MAIFVDLAGRIGSTKAQTNVDGKKKERKKENEDTCVRQVHSISIVNKSSKEDDKYVGKIKSKEP